MSVNHYVLVDLFVFSTVELYVFGHLSVQLIVYIMTLRWSAWSDLGQFLPHYSTVIP